MITKLKWLKAYFDRAILPLAGNPIGKILYTAKNTTGRRTQYVIDLDTNHTQLTTINASPADPLTSPGAIVITDNAYVPQTDKSLYIFGGSTLPVFAKTVQAAFTQTIAVSGSITAINVLTGVTRNGVAATVSNATPVSVTATGLTLNVGTGAVTLNSNSAPGVFTLDYKVTDKNEPSVFVSGRITVTVTP